MSEAAEARAARLAETPFEVVTPVSQGAVHGFIRAVREIWGQRELLDRLVRRELTAKYKDSSLGFLWTLIRPLVMLGIYYFAIGKVLGAERGIPSFAIFVFAGLTLWGLFSEITTSGTMSIIANAGLIKKVYLPREIFPLAATGAALFNFGVQLIVLLAATLLLGQFPWHAEILYAIPGIAVALTFAVGLAVLLSAVNVYLRDVQYLVEVALLVAFWVSPIVYSYGFVQQAVADAALPGWLLEVYLANPVTVAILAFQKAMWVAGGSDPAVVYPEFLDLRLLVMFVIGLAFVWFAQRVFERMQGNFAQEI